MKPNIEILKASSSVFLCEVLPDNWYDLSEEEQNEFLTLNAWQPFENESADELWAHIECHADSITELFSIAERGAVKMAVDDKFPLDLGEFSIEGALDYDQAHPSTDDTLY